MLCVRWTSKLTATRSFSSHHFCIVTVWLRQVWSSAWARCSLSASSTCHLGALLCLICFLLTNWLRWSCSIACSRSRCRHFDRKFCRHWLQIFYLCLQVYHCLSSIACSQEYSCKYWANPWRSDHFYSQSFCLMGSSDLTCANAQGERYAAEWLNRCQFL